MPERTEQVEVSINDLWDRMHDVDYNTALTEAIADVTANWERYRADFTRRRP